MSYRVLVTGGRDYTDWLAIENELAKLPPDTVIVHGDMRGADTIAKRTAMRLGFIHEPHPANWKRYGKKAGPMRNQEMVDSGAELCIAFPGGSGTADCVARANRAGIPVQQVGRRGAAA